MAGRAAAATEAACAPQCATLMLPPCAACLTVLALPCAGRTGAALGLLGAAGCITVLAVIVARFDDVGYAFVVSLSGRMIWPGGARAASPARLEGRPSRPAQIAFVILVSVVPIGMPVVTGAVLAAGAREMARERAIVTRLSALEELSGMEVLCSDKTGTLTLNRLTLDKEDVEVGRAGAGRGAAGCCGALDDAGAGVCCCAPRGSRTLCRCRRGAG